MHRSKTGPDRDRNLEIPRTGTAWEKNIFLEKWYFHFPCLICEGWKIILPRMETFCERRICHISCLSLLPFISFFLFAETFIVRSLTKENKIYYCVLRWKMVFIENQFLLKMISVQSSIAISVTMALFKSHMPLLNFPNSPCFWFTYVTISGPFLVGWISSPREIHLWMDFLCLNFHKNIREEKEFL